MPLGFIKKIFSPGVQSVKAVDDIVEEGVKEEVLVSDGNADPVAFVEFIVPNLVSQPEAVKIEVSRESEDELAIFIACDKSDMGRVIGKRGKTISAIRTLAIDAAGRAGISSVKVELQD